MNYELKRSKRKTMSIKVTAEGRIIVSVPLRTTQKAADAFVEANDEWIKKALEKTKKRLENKAKYIIPESDIPLFKRRAKEYLPERTMFWAEKMGLSPAYVHITSAEKRYGSCNAKKGICFSYRLMAYPEDVIDYVIIHELSHLVHFNHSAAFYGLIEKYMPDYKKKQNILNHKE